MAFRACVLGSGSSGNCIFVESGDTRILIDGGLSCRETGRRLATLSVELSHLCGVCVTHEHEDHKAALGQLHRRFGIPLYGNAATIEALRRDVKLTDIAWNVFTTGAPFEVGSMRVTPFSVPHDCYDPVGFVVEAEQIRMSVVTDLGTPTGLVRERLRECDVVIIEANHDEGMLRDSGRPWPLKKRISGIQGHLSNDQTAELVADVAGPRLRTVVLAHLSAECNRPDVAMHAVRTALDKAGYPGVDVKMTYPDRISDIIQID